MSIETTTSTNRIKRLDDNLINKIAAGEVVERPASVVKELVENCLDASATKVTVELREGGRKRILVSDNGSGMSKTDAFNALLRHATSKIRDAEDLFNLNTMGFRGEALASISSVCKFTLMTCEQGSTDGVRLQTDGGGQLEETPWQSAGGTTMICDDIFYNVPVRQKFLKAAQAEYGAVLEFMRAVAMSSPHVDFTLVHNGKEVLRASTVEMKKVNNRLVMDERALRARFAQVMGGDAGLGMIYAAAEGPYASMTALISAPGVERTTAKDMLIFVNGRWVKDKSLRFAVLRGYHSHLLRGKYPVVALFLTLDSGLVDANVHPAKTEVRLQYATEIHSMVAGAIREGLRKADWASHSSHEALAPKSNFQSSDNSDNAPAKSFWSGKAPSSAASVASLRTPPDWGEAPKAARWRDVTPVGSSEMSTRSANLFDDLASDVRSSFASPQVSATQSVPWHELSYMGAVADCYLLFGHGDRRSGARLLAVDQHAFHERVLYERLIRNTELLRSSQTLLVPEGVTLDPGAVESLKGIKAQLESTGFRFDIIDDSTVEVRAVPVLLAKSELQTLFESLARHEKSAMPLEGNAGLTHDILATMACHGAVRAGEALGESELKTLINEAKDVDFFHNCPHGRRVFRWWDEAQIARWFDR